MLNAMCVYTYLPNQRRVALYLTVQGRDFLWCGNITYHQRLFIYKGLIPKPED